MLFLKKMCPFKMVAAAILLCSHNSYADFYVTTESGEPTEFYVDFVNEEIENVAGSKIEKDWDLGRNYQAVVHCDKPTVYLHSFLYKADANLPLSDINKGFLKLNDYLDVKFEIAVVHSNNSNTVDVAVPFNDISNAIFQDSCTPPYTVRNLAVATGSKGKITVLLRKKVINGSAVSANHTIDLFAKLNLFADTANSSYGPAPLVRIIFSAGEIVVPDRCIVNNGALLEVNFGNIGADDLDGKKYQQPLDIAYECTGGSFDNGGDVGIKMSVSGVAASFNQDYLTTSMDNLGIQLKRKNDSTLVIPNTFYSMGNAKRGEWNLIAAPVSNTGGKAIDAGFFDASATVVMEFE